MLRGALSGLSEQGWRGLLLGAGLVLSDRLLVGWRRPVRWAVGLGVFTTALNFVPAPNSWSLFVRDVLSGDWGALRSWLAGFPLWTLTSAAARGFLGYWLGRAVPSPRRRYHCLEWAGVQARAIAAVALFPIEVIAIWGHREEVFGHSIRLYVLNAVVGTLTEAARGALEGAAVAAGLNAIGEPLHVAKAPADAEEDAPEPAEPEE